MLERFCLSLLQSVNLWIIRCSDGEAMVLAGIAIGIGNIQVTPSLINIAATNVSETRSSLVSREFIQNLLTIKCPSFSISQLIS